MTAAEDLDVISAPEAARVAREQMSEARRLLIEAGFKQTRVDQLTCGPVMVETGYTYGESRLTVHVGGQVHKLLLFGRDTEQFDRFRDLVMV